MTAKIRINPVAASDLLEIKSYIVAAEEEIDVALKVVKKIIEKIESLAEFPEIGSTLMHKIGLKSKYRYVICGQYLIFYIYEGDAVSIQRILHGKRDYMALLQEHKKNH